MIIELENRPWEIFKIKEKENNDHTETDWRYVESETKQNIKSNMHATSVSRDEET